MNPGTTDSLISIQDVTRRHGSDEVLRIDRLTVDRGGILGLAGPNGSGKSTLLRILALIEPATTGRIIFDGRAVDHNSLAARRRISLMLQDPYLLKRSVFDNVAYGIKAGSGKRLAKTEIRSRVEESLKWVGLPPQKFASRSWSQLSGGEAQRVALAARLVLKPRLLLMDEPTASVDASSAALIKEAALRAREDWSTTLIIASHDMGWLGQVADRTVHLYDGALIKPGLTNLVVGPWRTGAPGTAYRELDPDQRIVALAPDGLGDVPRFPKTATIDPNEITLSLERPEVESRANLIRGRVIKLCLESRSVSVQVLAGSQALTALMTTEACGAVHLSPGREVWLRFTREAVHWL